MFVAIFGGCWDRNRRYGEIGVGVSRSVRVKRLRVYGREAMTVKLTQNSSVDVLQQQIS